MKIYRVKNWLTKYENNRSREVKALTWVPVPNRLDADDYLTLVDRTNGAALFGVWVAVLMVASRCAPRGYLLRDSGSPHDAASLARVTRLNEMLVSETLEVAATECGLLELVDQTAPQATATIPQATTTTPQATATIPHNVVPKERTNEGNEGIEQKRTKERNEDRSSARSVEREGNGTVSLTLVDKALPTNRAKELEAWCLQLLGKDEMALNGSRWRKRAAEQPDKLGRVLGDTKSAHLEGRVKTTTAKFAEDAWKRFE